MSYCRGCWHNYRHGIPMDRGNGLPRNGFTIYGSINIEEMHAERPYRLMMEACERAYERGRR